MEAVEAPVAPETQSAGFDALYRREYLTLLVAQQ
jgi:hypothetical protein